MMDAALQEPFERLALARRRAGFATASEAARAFGWNENTYRSHENGERGLRLDTAYKYAKAFKADVQFILLGKEDAQNYGSHSRTIVGYIDENAAFNEYPADGVDGFQGLVALTGLKADGSYWFAEVKSKMPILGCHPGDLLAVFNNNLHEGRWRNFSGCLVIIEIDSGQQLLRRLRPAPHDDLVDIQISSEMAPQYAKFKFISPVYAIVQQRFWGRVTRDQVDKNPHLHARVHDDLQS